MTAPDSMRHSEVADLLAELRERGVSLVLTGAGDVRVRGPVALVAGPARDSLREHKGAIVALLLAETADAAGPCDRCGRAAWFEYGAEVVAGALVCGDCIGPADIARGAA